MDVPSHVDYALARNRHFWLQHPVLGSPSWIQIDRDASNPLYVGHPPYEWPVNGFLFYDPPSHRWYAYIGLYPTNYWPPGGCLLLREEPDGTWREIGVVLKGDPKAIS